MVAEQLEQETLTLSLEDFAGAGAGALPGAGAGVGAGALALGWATSFFGVAASFLIPVSLGGFCSPLGTEIPPLHLGHLIRFP